MGAFNELQSAIDEVARQKAGLDGQYAKQRADIESQYQLSETAEERQMLDRLLQRLDDEREQSTQQLREGYNQAREQVLQRVQSATGAGDQEVQQLASNFEQAYSQIAAEEQGAAQRYSRAGIPVNVGGATDTGMQDTLARSAAAMGEAATARNAITQEDIAWMADSLLGQREASVGEAGRIATRVGGAASGAHNQQVQDRIAQDRRLQAQAFQGLDARFDDRRDSLLGRHGDLVSQLAQMREQRRQFDAQLAEQQAARAAAARRSSGGGRSGGGSGGSSSSGPTAAGLQLDPAALQAHLDSLAKPYTRSGEVPNQTFAGSRFYPGRGRPRGIAKNAGFGLPAGTTSRGSRGGAGGGGSVVR